MDPCDFLVAEGAEPFLARLDAARDLFEVKLDLACRRQQLGEGWFQSLDEVPSQAISMSVRQIMKSRAIVVACPDARKAWAVKTCLAGPVSPLAPASILQQHPRAFIFLDPASAAGLGS
jgi:glucosamine-6-phosphate deaminase